MERDDREDLNRVMRMLYGMVRVGTVMDVDNDKHLARVIFRDPDLNSDWLPVVQHYAAGVHIEPDAEHDHPIHDTFTGGGSSENAPAHEHKGSYLTYWMPKINEQVLCLYAPSNDVSRADGFILGRIHTWR